VIFKFERQSGSEQNFMRGAEFDHRLFSQFPPAGDRGCYADRYSHRQSCAEELGQFLNARLLG
jgi:hypothetical protein